MPGYRIESCILKQSQDIEAQWCDLMQEMDCSYFQSWAWVENWLSLIALELHPVVTRVWSENKLVGLGLFVSKDIKRRLIFRARATYLNEYPFDGKNMIMECNGLLVAKGHEQDVYTAMVEYLLEAMPDHDEFCFGGMSENAAGLIINQTLNNKASCMIAEESVYRYVDLSDFESGVDGYLTCLSRNRRGQIRRSMRLYDETGDLQIEQAKDVEQALDYFVRLKQLHTNYWQSKDKSGSFANQLWEKFHRRLIVNRFAAGEVQLLKISNHLGDIAFIYNLVLNKHVYVVQTGFAQSEDSRLMPGYVAHSMAIAFNHSKKMCVYDLMHGEALYKSILCNRSTKLQWLVVQRKCLKFAVENVLLSTVRRIRKKSP